MKKQYTLISALALVLGICSCTHEEFGQDHYIESGDKVRLILTAERGESVSSPATRVYVGETSGGQNGTSGSVRYHWNTSDKIGVLPLNLGTTAAPNYESPLTEIMGDKNYAQFETYFTAEGFDATTNPQLLIYYPYNSSMLQGVSGSTGSSYASSGLTFRLPNIQEQYGYNLKLNETDHPSVFAVSNYGLAYDLASSNVVADGGDNEVTATGGFKLDHANTYFQFNVYGGQRTIFNEDGSSTEGTYANDGWKIASVNVEIGNCVVSSTTVDGKTEAVYTMTKQIPIAGTYKFSYQYSASHFTDGVSGYDNNDKIELESVAPLNVVQVNMRNMENAPELSDNVAAAVPAFVVINGLRVTTPATEDETNCMKVSVTAYKYDSEGKIEGSDTRIRYFNIEKLLETDIAGDYYTIPFEFCDPVESYTDLAVPSTANSYIVNAPGNYTFDIDIAGNGETPYGGFTAGITNPNDLIEEGKSYGFDWLWASGLTFDNVKASNPSLSDVEVVETIVNNVEISGETGRVSIGLATGTTETLSGNIILALYESNNNGSGVGEIVWTWHIWLGAPEVHHFKFPATSDGYKFTNENWYMLDRNIGAETSTLGNPRSTGLYYQRGRKEPLISFGNREGSTDWTANQIPTYANTNRFGDIAKWEVGRNYEDVTTPIKYPMSLIEDIDYSGSSDYYYAWNAASEVSDVSIANDTKSMFDPCPPGYRLPTTREWDNFKNNEFTDYTANELASGAFGYCYLKDLEGVLSSSNSTDQIIAQRIAAGNFYTVNDQYERTYTITDLSGTGTPQIVKFPNSGVLYADGELAYINQVDTRTEVIEHTIPAGPALEVEVVTSEEKISLEAPEITSPSEGDETTSSSFTVRFSSNQTYYYSIGEETDNPTSSFSGSSATIYFNSSYNNRISLGLSSNTTKSIYFYLKDANGNLSNASYISVTRSGNNGSRTYTYDSVKNGASIDGTVNIGKATISFTDASKTYYYGAAKEVISGSEYEVNCSTLEFSVSNGKYIASLPFYTRTIVDGQYFYSETVVNIERTGTSSYAYSLHSIVRGEERTITTGGEVTGTTSEAALAMWSSGRVEGTKYEFFWFGPMRIRTNDMDLWLNTSAKPRPSFYASESREHWGIGYAPYGLWGVQDEPGKGGNGSEYTNANRGAATVARCIREYDNVATANE